MFDLFLPEPPTAATYTLSLHDALPILPVGGDELHLGHLRAQPFLDVREVRDARHDEEALAAAVMFAQQRLAQHQDRKSTRLNSSHSQISYAVFCLKKKKKTTSIVRDKS